jgi:AraC family transcriptional activator of pobA
MLYAKPLECALRARSFSLTPIAEGRNWHGVLLDTGAGIVRAEETDLAITAPSLTWIPSEAGLSLSIEAGSDGILMTATEDTAANAIGHNAEAAELRLLIDRAIRLPLDNSQPGLSDLKHAFDVILRETARRGSGSAALMEAQLKTVLVLMWRGAALDKQGQTAIGRSARVLQHFRQLVETHFRNHRTIGDYAREIGVTPDRLHDICTRNLGRPPRQLVHERLVHEARMMLETTSLSADQISAALGFRDTAYFSRFFRVRVGFPPAAYRREHAAASARRTDRMETTFADWP